MSCRWIIFLSLSLSLLACQPEDPKRERRSRRGGDSEQVQLNSMYDQNTGLTYASYLVAHLDRVKSYLDLAKEPLAMKSGGTCPTLLIIEESLNRRVLQVVHKANRGFGCEQQTAAGSKRLKSLYKGAEEIQITYRAKDPGSPMTSKCHVSVAEGEICPQLEFLNRIPEKIEVTSIIPMRTRGTFRASKDRTSSFLGKNEEFWLSVQLERADQGIWLGRYSLRSDFKGFQRLKGSKEQVIFPVEMNVDSLGQVAYAIEEANRATVIPLMSRLGLEGNRSVQELRDKANKSQEPATISRRQEVDLQVQANVRTTPKEMEDWLGLGLSYNQLCPQAEGDLQVEFYSNSENKDDKLSGQTLSLKDGKIGLKGIAEGLPLNDCGNKKFNVLENLIPYGEVFLR